MMKLKVEQPAVGRVDRGSASLRNISAFNMGGIQSSRLEDSLLKDLYTSELSIQQSRPCHWNGQ